MNEHDKSATRVKENGIVLFSNFMSVFYLIFIPLFLHISFFVVNHIATNMYIPLFLHIRFFVVNLMTANILCLIQLDISIKINNVHTKDFNALDVFFFEYVESDMIK